jgi:DNA topoisomerase VI subunit A
MDLFIQGSNLINMVSLLLSKAIKDLKWIGLHSEEIKKLKLTTQKLSEIDKNTINRILQYSQNEEEKKELNFMMENDIKAEIETLNELGYNFISEYYIPEKILY